MTNCVGEFCVARISEPMVVCRLDGSYYAGTTVDVCDSRPASTDARALWRCV